MLSSPGLKQILCVSLFVSACQASPALLPASHTSSVPQTKLTPSAGELRTVRFVFKPEQDFRTQASSTRYIKLVINGGASPIYAVGADTNTGFLTVPESGNVTISAQVPDGSNYTASLGLYANQDSSPFYQVKTAFHVPASTVTISFRTYLLGQLVDELRQLNSPLLNNPLNLAELQHFLDGLTGYQNNGDSISFTRLASLKPPSPLALDAKLLAYHIHTNTVSDLSQSGGSTLNPQAYLKLPLHLANYRAIPFTNGIDQIPAIGLDKSIHFNDYDGDATNGTVENLYAVNVSGSGISTSLSQRFTPQARGDISSQFLSLGTANNTGENQLAATFFSERLSNGNTVVKATEQETGNLIWQHSIAGTNLSPAPLLLYRRNFAAIGSGRESCSCANDSLVIAAINASSTSVAGIYALAQNRPSTPNGSNLQPGDSTGQQIWRYPLVSGESISHPGAFSPDGSKVYFVSSAPALIILDRATGTEVARVGLPAAPSGGPAIGHNGSVYLALSTSNFFTEKVQAYSATGTKLWGVSSPVENTAHRPISNLVVDYRNDQDIVYALSQISSAASREIKVSSLNGSNGSTRWNFQVPTSKSVYASLLIGAEADGSRLLYMGSEDSFIYAIRDKNTEASLEWKVNPGGNLWNGLSLKDGLLYATTRDGGDGQIIALQAVKVTTPEMPSSAPWPKTGGHLRNAGVPNHITSF